MPNLPVYNQQRNIEVTRSATLRNEAAQSFKDDQKVISTVNEISQKIGEANDVMQYNEAKTSYNTQIAEIQAKAIRDPDFKNADNYYKEIEKVKSQSLSLIDNQQVAQKALFEFDYDASIAKIRIDTDAQGKKLVYNKNLLKVSLEQSGEKIFNAMLSGQSNMAEMEKANQLRMIDANIATGVITPDEAVKLKKSATESLILKYAETDPTVAMKILDDNKNMYSAKEKESVINNIKSIADVNAKKEEIQKVNDQYKNQQDFVTRSKEGISFEQALKELDAGIEFETMNKQWAESKKKALLSTKSIDAKTKNDYFYDIVRNINEAQAEYNIYGDEKSASSFTKALIQAEIKINEGQAKGYLSDTDAGTLTNRIYTKEAAEAKYDASDDLAEAVNYFEKELPRKQALEAVRTYVLATEGRDTSNLNNEDMLRNIKAAMLRKEDPSFRMDDKTDLSNVRLFRVYQEVENIKTGERMVLDEGGKWVPVQ